MKTNLSFLSTLQSGVFLKPQPLGDTLYLQGRHFDGNGIFNKATRPELLLNQISTKHLLQDGDVLFAAKGQSNYAVVYNAAIGHAVASSIFIVIRLLDKSKTLPHYLAWFLSQPAIINILLKDVKLSTIPSVNMQQLAALEINIPGLKKQELIIRIDQLIKKEKRLAYQIQNLKQNFLQQQLLEATK